MVTRGESVENLETAEVWELLLKAHKLLRKMLQSEAYKEGLTFNDVSLLYLAKSKGEVTVTDIANYLDVSKSTVVEMVEKLSSMGLIVKEKGSTDRRLTLIRVTEKGEEVLEKVRERYRAFIEKIIARVGDEDCVRKVTLSIIKEFIERTGGK